MKLYEEALSRARYWAECAIRETEHRNLRDQYVERAAHWSTIALAMKPRQQEC